MFLVRGLNSVIISSIMSANLLATIRFETFSFLIRKIMLSIANEFGMTTSPTKGASDRRLHNTLIHNKIHIFDIG